MDTMTSLALSVVGGFAGGVLVSVVVWRRLWRGLL